MRKLLSIMALFVISLLAVSMVSASHSASTLGSLTLANVGVKVNDRDLTAGQRLAVEKGEKLDIEVRVENSGNVSAEGIEVVARLSGYGHSDDASLEDASAPFDVRAGTSKFVNLELTVPRDVETDLYTLRVLVLDRNSAPIVQNFVLDIEAPRHSVDIRDVSFSPGNTVKAGQSLLASVLVKNFGDDTEEDVKVSVEVPELGLTATEYISEIESEKSEEVSGSTEEFFIQIPAATAAGDYDVVVTVEYDDMAKTVSHTEKLHVVANELFKSADKLVLAAGPAQQTVAAGKTATYGIALSNEGRSSKAYTISTATGGSWATASLSDSLVVLEAGRSKVVYVDLAVAQDAPVGEHTASVEISSGDNVLETVALKANVVAGTQASGTANLRNGLEIAMVILVVVLVIVGLIVGFSRLRKDNEEDQTYY